VEREKDQLRKEGRLLENTKKERKASEKEKKERLLKPVGPASVQEVNALMDKLQSFADANDADQAVTTMYVLEETNISNEVLRETNLGKKIRELKKHSNPMVERKATQLLGQLKARAKSTITRSIEQHEKSNPAARKAKEEKLAKEQEEASKSAGDLVRETVRKKLGDILGTDSLAKERAEEIETAMHAMHADDLVEYKKLFGLILMPNLKRNEALREKVRSGQLPAVELIRLDPKQMATKEQLDKEMELREETWKDIMVADAPKDVTDQFQCGKCKGRACTYYQKQTRSADEPMTTFITCTLCNTNWKEC